MAHVGSLYISEYRQIGQAAMDAVQAPKAPPLVDQSIEIHDDKATVSEPFTGGTSFIDVWADCPCWLGWTGDAKVGLHPLPAGKTYCVQPGIRLSVHGGKL